ncbi:hypothetical protein SERLA73DRAFT_176622 [Serpula lacrymans var. lacrymans S7.3]|uniref:MARVEL domain-containing protein n=2 Tax=Serpula lacrymans var. lacrymans TaxID=341189 RepID=F8PNC1_SERL3|nr:uncharacterized protein SERLADRAFT_459716 [Serpula lacrymans var. lacrymans S7.9]EGO03103.1 hypothetical protein SERLA73DRAFT_176622 [Serpula lacrymans var. lacrymans S7.3]EGO28865.1 hypothetical protein SERLADRAFT_459716 [Serpula lacrymans var. lacrymans S7.9]
MPLSIHIIRVFLYCLLFVFSVILLALCATRLHYTTHLDPDDPLNYGVNFYDPIVAELTATTVITLFWSTFIARTIYGRYEHRFLNTFMEEIIGLFILFLLWLVGAAIATASRSPGVDPTKWGKLMWCQHYWACRILTTLLAFAWLGWLVVFALLVISCLFAFANRSWREPLHGRWDPRATRYRDSQMRGVGV